MTRILSKIRIDEVSAVTRGAGEDCRILLMKRDDTPRSKPHVERHARRLRKFQEMFDSPERDQRRSFNEIMAKADADGDEKDDLMADNINKAHRNRGAGPHGLTGALLEHLHDRLERRREQHGYQKREEGPLDQHQELISIMKDCGGPVSVCKAIVDRGRSPCGEHELVRAASRVIAGAGVFGAVQNRKRVARLPGREGHAVRGGRHARDGRWRRYARLVRHEQGDRAVESTWCASMAHGLGCGPV